MKERTISLTNRRIQIAFPFDARIITSVKGINGRVWNAGRRVWELPMTSWHANHVIQVLDSYNFNVDPEVVELSTAPKVVPDIRVEYIEGLYAFQRDCVDFIAKAGGRCIIADEMGLGKTVESLAFVKLVSGRVLIISPANVVYKWEAEVKRWLPDRTVQVVTKGSDELESVDIHIMSYAIAVRQYKRLSKLSYKIMIVDECHYVKSPRSQRGRVVKSISRVTDHLLFLSGTPFLNRPSELFNVLNMIDIVQFGNYFQFASSYCGAYYADGMWVFPPNTLTNRDELAERLAPIMIRRTKRDVLKELPDLTRSVLPVSISNMTEYNQARRDVKQWVKENKKLMKNPEHVLSKLNILRQVVGRGKVDASIELAESLLDDDTKKVVLFAHHKEIISLLAERLKLYGVRVISGETPQKERMKNTQEFQSGNSRVILITVAGSEGIDLFSINDSWTNCDIIFVEREWTPAREEQAESRLHRLCQKDAVSAWYVVAKGTVDERMEKIISDKRKIIGQVVKQDEILTALLEEL